MNHTNLKRRFDPERFKSLGHDLIDRLAVYLEQNFKEANPVTQYITPETELEFWNEYSVSSFDNFVDDLLKRSINVQHPGYIGHQVSVPMPEIALIGLVSDLVNNGMGIYEMGQAPTAMEKIVCDEMCRAIGFSDNAGGFLTSGGTLANLTALLAARVHLKDTPADDSYILVSDQAHFCIARAAQTMGLPKDNVIRIESDDNFCIRMDHLEDAYEEIIASGGQVMAVVGCACSTSTGSYDDLMALGAFCQSRKLWFHVDGAHGGAAVFSKSYKALLRGLENADSVIIDAHKMMLTPALATFVLFKDDALSYAAFNQKAEYLYEQTNPDWFQLAKRTYETTKYMMSAKIFWLLKSGGYDLLDAFVTRQYDLARTVAELIKTDGQLELACMPMSNIVCYRFISPTFPPDKLSALNKDIRKAIIDQGDFYIVQTELRGDVYLRITIMHLSTDITHLKNLIASCKAIGQRLIHDHVY